MNQLRYVLLVVTAVAIVGVSALALNVPNTFVAGEVISAAEMNQNFAAVETAVSTLETQLTALQAAQPVVAYRYRAGQFDLNNAALEAEDVAVVSIDAPAAGVVVVEATAQVGLSANVANYLVFLLDTEPGGTPGVGAPHGHGVGASGSAGYTTNWNPVAIQRAFTVTAGTHEFRLKARALTGTGSKWFWNTSVRATWYPAGSVDLQSLGLAAAEGFGNQ